MSARLFLKNHVSFASVSLRGNRSLVQVSFHFQTSLFDTHTSLFEQIRLFSSQHVTFKDVLLSFSLWVRGSLFERRRERPSGSWDEVTRLGLFVSRNRDQVVRERPSVSRDQVTSRRTLGLSTRLSKWLERDRLSTRLCLLSQGVSFRVTSSLSMCVGLFSNFLVSFRISRSFIDLHACHLYWSALTLFSW